MTILSRTLLVVGLVASAAGAAIAAPTTSVGYRDADTATHPHLKSYRTRTVEGGKETFSETHDYGADGRLQKRKSYKDGQLIDTVDYTWDADGHLVKRVSKDDAGETSTHVYSYKLDKAARIESVQINADGKEVYRWNAKGDHEVTASHSDGKGNDVFDMSTTFDADGKVLKRCVSTGMITTAIKPTTSCELHEYDKHGELKRVTQKPADKFHPTETYANSYDKQGRLIKVVPSSKDRSVKVFTWNANGDIASVSEGSGAEAMVTTFTYEAQ